MSYIVSFLGKGITWSMLICKIFGWGCPLPLPSCEEMAEKVAKTIRDGPHVTIHGKSYPVATATYFGKCRSDNGIIYDTWK